MKTLLTFLTVVFIAFGPLHGQESKDFSMMPSNYFVGNSSYSLKKGQAYYANTWLFFNDFYYGITDHISVGTGMMPLFLLDGAPTPVWIKAKVAYPVMKNKFNVSAGLLGTTILNDDNDEFSLNFFTGFTVGNPRNNFSFNYYLIGIGYMDDFVFLSGGTHIFSLSGRLGITPRSFIMTDNFVFLINSNIYSSLTIVGMQTLFHGLLLDYGLFVPLVEGIAAFYAFPYLGVKIPIGKNW